MIPLLILALGASGAFAQASGAPKTVRFEEMPVIRAGDTVAPPRPPPPPSAQMRRAQYDAEARELAQVLGAAHYLRWLCYGRRDQMWREFMAQLLDKEDQRLRDDLAEAFNDGFDAERLRFDACTPRAQASEVEWKAKGLRLADGLAARYRD